MLLRTGATRTDSTTSAPWSKGGRPIRSNVCRSLLYYTIYTVRRGRGGVDGTKRPTGRPPLPRSTADRPCTDSILVRDIRGRRVIRSARGITWSGPRTPDPDGDVPASRGPSSVFADRLRALPALSVRIRRICGSVSCPTRCSARRGTPTDGRPTGAPPTEASVAVPTASRDVRIARSNW